MFAISALVEGAIDKHAANLPTDLYGRRDPLVGAVEGLCSVFTNFTATLENDFDFGWFDANQTLNSSGNVFLYDGGSLL